MKHYTYTVCIATYNGEKYIEEQLNSIINQLDDNDEIIISDDGSTDNTLEIIEKISNNSNIIKIYNGPKQGFSCNFGNALKYATKDIVCFSDQDDIWSENKIQTIDKIFFENNNITTLLHNMSTFRTFPNVETNEISISYHKGVFKNFIKSSYWGCCMACKNEFLQKIIPFKPYCVGHDQLIGLFSEKVGKTYYIKDNFIYHRLHDDNTSHRRSLYEMITFRINLFKDYMYSLKNFNKE